MSKKNKHDQQYYLKLTRRCLMDIARLGPSQGVAFIRLKEKAKKYLEKAKAFEPKVDSDSNKSVD